LFLLPAPDLTARFGLDTLSLPLARRAGAFEFKTPGAVVRRARMI